MSATKRSKAAKATLTLKLIRLSHAKGLKIPEYQTASSAGVDLQAAVPARASVTLKPSKRCLIPTGLIVEIPKGYEGQVRSRSGLALKHGITVLNSPGTIDADYRGELGVILINLGDTPFKISRGERIAQLIIAPMTQAKMKEVRVVSTTHRGSGGFGSTGVKSKTRRATAAKNSSRKSSTGKKSRAQ